jgi:CRISPR-associated exonuclease Cas4
MGGEPIPLSALQHAVYCLRQAALIHLERQWADNRFTAEGHVLHAVADKPGKRMARGVHRATALPVASKRLNIAGIADVVEFHSDSAGRDRAFPVEYKRGKAKLHRADEVQLCAQALCLEEMTGQPVLEGAIFYAETKRRVVVPFDVELRTVTEETVRLLQQVFSSMKTPAPVYRADRCRACSLQDLCQPKAASKSVISWREKMLFSMLEKGDET